MTLHRMLATLLLVSPAICCASSGVAAPYVRGNQITEIPDSSFPKHLNAIANLKATQLAASIWQVEFDYYYEGRAEDARLKLDIGTVRTPAGKSYETPFLTQIQSVLPGAHHVVLPVPHPPEEGQTRIMEMQMLAASSGTLIASQRIDQVVDWPSAHVAARDKFLVESTPDVVLGQAMTMIDTNDQEDITEARILLEYLISRNPSMEGAYVELARTAMKSNWGPEGLHQAETYLDTALRLNPGSVNAKILRGYVYTHQHQYDKAEALFKSTASGNPRNLWLWVNWGDLLWAQGKPEQAELKYREAIKRPVTHDTYDRARVDAYRHLLELLEKKGTPDVLEALYRQRMAEYGPGSCYTTDYARFLLQVRGDTARAIELARGALNQDCEDSPARQMLGLAQYVKWSATAGAESEEALNQAHVYLPAGPKPLYLLATSDRTLPAARKLIASGESIEQKDNQRITALGLAIQNNDVTAVRRLISLGASPTTGIGEDDMPAAMLPVLEGNVEVVRELQKAGVDYSKVRYRGMSGVTIARQTGSDELVALLDKQGAKL